jgi:hypothetical protein
MPRKQRFKPNRKQKIELLAEKAQVEKLLAAIPEENTTERMTLTSKLQRLEERLSRFDH